MSFSERMGYKSSDLLGLEEVSDELKMAIWNQTCRLVQYCIGDMQFFEKDKKYFPRALWSNFFHQALNKIPSAHSFLSTLEAKFWALEWNKIYDLIDFILIEFIQYSTEDQEKQQEAIASIFNEILEKHNAPYRICNNLVQPIISTQSITVAESANKLAQDTDVQLHLNNAEQSFSLRQPGSNKFINACRESICALEVTLKLYFSNNETISQNVRKLKYENKIHSTLIKCIENISTFRGDASGVAHGAKIKTDKLQEPPPLPNTLEDAVLIHTLCCGFINFFMPKIKNSQ